MQLSTRQTSQEYPAPTMEKQECTRSWQLLSNEMQAGAQVMLEDGSVVPMDGSLKQRILKDVDSMAARALRCLAFAQKASPLLPSSSPVVDVNRWLAMMP